MLLSLVKMTTTKYDSWRLVDPTTLALRMNQIESFTENAMRTGRLVNGKVQISSVNVLYPTAAEENISEPKSNLKLTFKPRFQCCKIQFQHYSAEFSGVQT
jgi:hypothetical protein